MPQPSAAQATGDNSRVAALREKCGDDFLLYSGEDAMGREFVALGGDGVISVTANVAPAAPEGSRRGGRSYLHPPGPQVAPAEMAEILGAPQTSSSMKLDSSLRTGQEKGATLANFKGSYLGQFPLVSADFSTSDHLSERSRSVHVLSGSRARGTPTSKRR